MRGNVFKKLAAAVVSLSMLGSAAVMPVSATDYADQAVDISKFDKGCTYTADTDTAAITIGTGGKQAWSKLDLTPYTTKKGDHISSVKVSYTETVPSGGRSQIGFFDNDLADWANNAYQSTVGSAVCYGVLGRDVEKRFYYYDGGKETKLAGKFAVDSSENVEITFDLDNEKMSGNVGAQTFTDLPINIDSIDTMAIYSWSEMTYTLSNLKITTVVSDENYYTVTYSVNGTETTESVVKNGNVKKIPDTDLSGYTFKGWSTDGTTVYDETETYMTTEEVQAAAVTAPVTYTAVYEQDTSYIEPIVSAVVSGASSMTFGADPNTAAENPYRVTITGEKGTVIDADTIDSRVTDFNVEWDIDGFKTENDTEGQYCDSYGSFSVNNSASASTVFNLRNVPMNFYGKLTATITYNGSTIEATPIYVVALGNTTQGTHDVLPSGGYPSDFSKYPSSLVGYTAAVSGDNKTGTDIITDNFVVVGSDSGKGATLKEENGVKYFNITKNTAKKSAMFAHPLSLNAVQTIYKQRLRFNSDGATITFTTGYPIWNDKNKYAATFSYTGGQASLNDMLLLSGENAAAVTTSTWYDLVISLDSTCSKAWAKLYKTDGTLVGEISNVAFTDAGTNPTFYAVGMGNSNTGSVDFAGYSVYYPAADNTKFELNASQTTLSIPNGDSATLSASLKSTEGYDMTAEAEWSILEDDMKTGITITPSEDDSHTATVTLDNTA